MNISKLYMKKAQPLSELAFGSLRGKIVHFSYLYFFTIFWIWEVCVKYKAFTSTDIISVGLNNLPALSLGKNPANDFKENFPVMNLTHILLFLKCLLIKHRGILSVDIVSLLAPPFKFK